MALLPVIRWQVIADYLILAAAFYVLLRWARSARALRLALGVVGLHVLALVARNLDLVITSWILDASAILSVLVLLLIFQPELRRAFMRLDSALRRWPRPLVVGTQANRAIAHAAFELAGAHLGALLVITRKDSIGELIDGGILLGAAVSSELLESIFQKVSPLHDGAVIVEGGHITRANAVLPLSRRQDLPNFYGTRHRAAVGLAERCDALVIAVSEERAEVTVIDGGKIQHMKNPEEFVATLEGLLSPPRETSTSHFRRLFSANLGLKFAALGLAAIVWSMSFLASGTTIRTVGAPVEFANVPSGTQVDEQSADTLEIQLRGSPWIMDSVSPGTLVARFDLGRLHTGWHTLEFHPDSLDLPPGIVVDRVTPRTLRVEVVQSGGHPRQQK
ncbi:MAG TPA: diadenylate cyclase [Bryobacteraceae bacterium]|nr:diadenylate cyclase [Bryobacteraceae bacterium]